MRYINWLEMRVSHDIHPLFPLRIAVILPITYGPWMGPLQKILFGFKPDDTHA